MGEVFGEKEREGSRGERGGIECCVCAKNGMFAKTIMVNEGIRDKERGTKVFISVYNSHLKKGRINILMEEEGQQLFWGHFHS